MGIKDKSAHRAYMKKYYERNKESLTEKMRIRYAENRDAILAKSKAKIKADPAKFREIFKRKGREWNESHPGYHATLNRKVYARYKELIINAYGGECYCCGEKIREFLTLDHILRDGKIERARFGNRLYRRVAEAGFPKDRYRLACMNCNWAERKGNPCPHKSQSDEMRLVSAC